MGYFTRGLAAALSAAALVAAAASPVWPSRPFRNWSSEMVVTP